MPLRSIEARYDLGEILRGGSIEARISIQNTSPRIAIIRRAEGSCRCLNVEGPTRIEPGATAEFAVTVVTRELVPGRHKKSLVIETSDPEESRLEVPLLWDVVELIQPVGDSMVRIAGLHDRDLSKTIVLERGTDMRVRIDGARSVQRRFWVTGVRSIQDGTRYEVDVVVPKTAKALRTTDTLEISLLCGDGAARKVSLSVAIDMRERIGFRPMRNIAFRRKDTRPLRTGSEVERRVHLVASEPSIVFSITGYQVLGDAHAFEVEIVTIRPGAEYAIVVRVPRYLDAKIARAQVIISTTDPKEKRKRLPLHAQFETTP